MNLNTINYRSHVRSRLTYNRLNKLSVKTATTTFNLSEYGREIKKLVKEISIILKSHSLSVAQSFKSDIDENKTKANWEIYFHENRGPFLQTLNRLNEFAHDIKIPVLTSSKCAHIANQLNRILDKYGVTIEIVDDLD